MTEQEAKTKWCPFARVGGPMHSEAQGTSYNRWPSSDGMTEAMFAEAGHIRCIGSACMAWRWEPSPSSSHARSYGYCGLAGKP